MVLILYQTLTVALNITNYTHVCISFLFPAGQFYEIKKRLFLAFIQQWMELQSTLVLNLM